MLIHTDLNCKIITDTVAMIIVCIDLKLVLNEKMILINTKNIQNGNPEKIQIFICAYIDVYRHPVL
jgi:hypothetical protein